MVHKRTRRTKIQVLTAYWYLHDDFQVASNTDWTTTALLFMNTPVYPSYPSSLHLRFRIKFVVLQVTQSRRLFQIKRAQILLAACCKKISIPMKSTCTQCAYPDDLLLWIGHVIDNVDGPSGKLSPSTATVRESSNSPFCRNAFIHRKKCWLTATTDNTENTET